MMGEHFHFRHDNSQKKALSFFETERDGTSASSKIEGDSVSIIISGKSPQNEDDTELICGNFLSYLKKHEDDKYEILSTDDTKYIDCLITNGDRNYQIQVVRVITEKNFWKGLAMDGEKKLQLSKDEVFQIIKGSIQHKIENILEEVRPTITLLLDSNRVQIFTSEEVLTEFIVEYGKFMESSLFSQIWIVGYDKTAIRQLH